VAGACGGVLEMDIREYCLFCRLTVTLIGCVELARMSYMTVLWQVFDDPTTNDAHVND
jgi:hypothetical protein